MNRYDGVVMNSGPHSRGLIQLFKTLTGVLVGLFLVFAHPVHAEPLVVFEATVGGFSIGQVVSSEKKLLLRAGESISLISNSGKIIQLEGPFNAPPISPGSVDGQDGGVRDAIRNLMSSKVADAKSLGVTRSADDVLKLASSSTTPLPDPWLIDATKGGNQCHLEGKRVIFWRADSSKSVDVVVRIGKGGWEGTTTWSRDKSKLGLPPTMPFNSGDTFDITVADHKVSAVIHLIPHTVKALPAQAAWMKGKGCQEQFLAMVRKLK